MEAHSGILAWRIHGQRSLVGYSPQGHKESDRFSDYHFYFDPSCKQHGDCLSHPTSYLSLASGLLLGALARAGSRTFSMQVPGNMAVQGPPGSSTFPCWGAVWSWK